MQARPRSLDLRNLEDVIAELQHLLDGGYRACGAWSLGQVAEHLSKVIAGSLDGFEAGTRVPWWRRTFGRLAWPLVMRLRRIPLRVEAPSTVLPSALVDDGAAVAVCQQLLLRLRDAGSTPGPHPSFGRLTPDQWRAFHCVHCSHHLSYLLPTR